MTKQRNPNSLANLKPFRPGESGNLSGRPKKKPLTEAYERLLEDPKFADKIARGLARSAVKGNVRAAAEIADRIEGKVVQEVNGAVGATIKIEFEVVGGKTDFTAEARALGLVG